MTIADATTTRGLGRHWKVQHLAGGALLAGAVFWSAPKAAVAQFDYNGTGGSSTNVNSTGLSWFNTSNWSYANATGTLPESFGGPLTPAVILCAPNTLLPSVGVVFDPANDPNTPGGPNANYVANLQASSTLSGAFYIAGVTTNGTEPAAPNKLTIESGTIVSDNCTVGRDSAGILALNGGTFVSNTRLKVQGITAGRTFIGTGTFEYHGGYLESGIVEVGSEGSTSGLSATSAGVGYFVVFNDGPAGAILSQNGFELSADSTGAGTVGIAEFHYDLNTGGVGGTRPIQNNWNDGNAEPGQGVLSLNNGTDQSARLNLVLDTAPSIVNGVVQNLGLFDETLIAGSGTYPRAFYSVDGSMVFTQGATISAAYAGKTYSWTISYSGQINFTDTATSAYNSTGIQATGGSDVVLVGVAVPEPGSLTILGGLASVILSRRRARTQRETV